MLKGFEQHTSHDDTIKESMERVKGLISLHCKEDAIYSAEIENTLNLVGPQVRTIVHAMRVQGHPVCSNTKGYFWGTREEVKETVRSLEQRLRSLAEVIRGMQNGLLKTGDQMHIGI
tara:strand:- start:869 stop:1219 length:351 start_codon:yes stop_codon:yes gene_type:complete